MTLLVYILLSVIPKLALSLRSALDTLEEVDISELFHLFNVSYLDHLLVVEENPGWLSVYRLADECHVVSKVRQW